MDKSKLTEDDWWQWQWLAGLAIGNALRMREGKMGEVLERMRVHAMGVNEYLDKHLVNAEDVEVRSWRRELMKNVVEEYESFCEWGKLGEGAVGGAGVVAGAVKRIRGLLR